MKKKALIAMSGGVDSSVAAYLMKEAGYDCIGVTMKLYDNEDIGMEQEKTCCSLSDIEDARSVAVKLVTGAVDGASGISAACKFVKELAQALRG